MRHWVNAIGCLAKSK